MSSRMIMSVVMGAAALGAVVAMQSGPALAAATKLQVQEFDNDTGKMWMELSATSVHSGKVDIDVVNKTSMKQVHELLLIKTDKEAKDLPLVADGTKIDEDQLKQQLTEVVELQPGKEGRKVVALSPGHYLLLCNQPGHVAAGMSTSLTVTQ